MELIKIEEREGKKLVSGRELHEFLESKQEFTHWMNNRVLKYQFVENEDFMIILSKSTGGRPSSDYAITTDMAKELSMVENNDKGREARRYFIACEKQVKQISQLDLIIQSAEALKLVTDRIENLEDKFDSVVTLESGKQRKLQKAIACSVLNRSKIIEYELITNNNLIERIEKFKKIKSKLFSAIHRELKNKFGVSSYKDIKVAEYETALNWIENWIENSGIREDI